MTSIGKYRWIPWKWKGGNLGNEYFFLGKCGQPPCGLAGLLASKGPCTAELWIHASHTSHKSSHLHTLQLRGQKDMSSVLFSWMLDFLFGSVAGPSRIIQVKKKPRNSVLLMTWAEQRAVWDGRRKSDLDYKLQGKYLHSNILGNLRKCLCKHV